MLKTSAHNHHTKNAFNTTLHTLVRLVTPSSTSTIREEYHCQTHQTSLTHRTQHLGSQRVTHQKRSPSKWYSMWPNLCSGWTERANSSTPSRGKSPGRNNVPADNDSAMTGQQDPRNMMEVSLCPCSEGTLQTLSRSCLNEKVARDEHIVQ